MNDLNTSQQNHRILLHHHHHHSSRHQHQQQQQQQPVIANRDNTATYDRRWSGYETWNGTRALSSLKRRVTCNAVTPKSQMTFLSQRPSIPRKKIIKIGPQLFDLLCQFCRDECATVAFTLETTNCCPCSAPSRMAGTQV